ncbi:hypothetical protein ACVW00_001675 [Marmoricola sp. URHA0025 HA25]
MSRSKLMGRIVVSACLALVVGCGGTSGEPGTASTQPAVLASPSPVTEDVRACAGVEAIISHITVDTVRWSPNLHPFDKTISSRLATSARELAAQGPQATDTDIQFWIRATAASFSAVATAMAAQKRKHVDKAIDQSRVAYKGLKQACSLDGR